MTGPASTAEDANTDAWRAADMGALNGHGTARGIATILSAIPNGGRIDGQRWLSPETIGLIFREQANGTDVILGMPLRWGIGYALPLPGLPLPATVAQRPDRRICFWGGWGGSLAIMDLDQRMTFVYVPNRMGAGLIGGPRSDDHLTAVYAALEG
ncbi:beta-lactamase family protein [Nakamurella alba]|uniref:beta-lactamase family protein n=1 Tax=Nakamurella alba TaxID=2665158 RepID=UPI001E487333|nr:beta-lactamase family protein [Nakamurella alba]